MKRYLEIFLIALIVATVLISIPLGSVKIPIKFLFGDIPKYMQTIIWELRLPRIMMALLIGMMLSSSGAVVQTIFQNPLADPYIIGISASATFGAVVAFVCDMPDIMYGIMAFITSLISTFVIFRLAKRGTNINITTLLIVGIAVSAFLGAFTSFAMYMIGEDSFKITMWTMGYLGNASWKRVLLLLIPLLISLVYFYIKRHELDLLLNGDMEAHAMGVDVDKIKIKMLGICAFIVAFSVAFSGMIGFVGLIIPHTIRLLVGSANKKLLPNTILAGGLFLLICDTIGRTLLAPVEIPIGVITAFFGAPFFLYLSFKGRKQ